MEHRLTKLSSVLLSHIESCCSFPSSLSSDPICTGASRILWWPLEEEDWEEEEVEPEGHSRE